LLAVTAIFVAFVVLLVVPPAPVRISTDAGPDPLVVKGALHIHTIRSDGGGTVDDVASAARAAGLQFVVLSEHGDGRDLLAPAYRSGVLCIDGSEVSTDGGHVAAIGLRPAEYRLGGAARDVVEDVHRLGGMAIAAHPVSPRDELAWNAWDVAFDGIEWLNADSEWRDEGSATLLRTAFGYLFRAAPALALTLDRPVAALSRADELASRRAVSILAGHDAHARIAQSGADGYGSRGVPLPSYQALFKTFAVRALLDGPLGGDAAADAAMVVRALRHGRVFTAVDALAAPARFTFVARSGGAETTIGGRLIPAGPVEFAIDADAPAGSRIVLLHNGQERASGAAPRLIHRAPAAPGAYRVEVHVPGAPGTPPVPWIVSSTLHVGLPTLAGPPQGYRERQPVTGTGWLAEHSSTSTGALSATAEGAELRYQLGSPGTSPYASLVLPVSIPGDARALSFTAVADRPMRVSVQFRSPEGGGDGRRWRRSVFIDSTERTITLPLDEFQAVPGTATGLREAAVDSLLFVVDTINADPGSSGSFGVSAIAWAR
jgi:hypothetical protein